MEKQSTSRLFRLVVAAVALFLLLIGGSILSACGGEHEHDFQLDQNKSIAATCGSTGYNVYTCSCGESYGVMTKTSGSHSFSNHYCSNCGMSEYTAEADTKALNDAISGVKQALDQLHQHSFKDGITVEPSCTAPGFTVQSCSCGASQVSNPVKPTGHHFTDKTVEATCGERGFTVHTCDVCKESYTDSFTEATGKHNEVRDPSLDEEANCKTPQAFAYRCTICGNVRMELVGQIDPNNHIWKQNDTETDEKYEAPKHGQAGQATFTCELCGKEDVHAIPALSEGHEYYTKEELTEKETGYYYLNDELYLVDVTVGCGVAGRSNQKCKVCGEWTVGKEGKLTERDEEKEVTEKALEHSPKADSHVEKIIKVILSTNEDDWHWDHKATWDKKDTTEKANRIPGSQKNTQLDSYYICEHCGEKIAESEPLDEDADEDEQAKWHAWHLYDATNDAVWQWHSWTAKEDDTHKNLAPTCTEEGYTWYYCIDKTCVDIQNEDGTTGLWYKDIVAPLGHLFKLVDTDIKGRDCKTPGTLHIVCVRITVAHQDATDTTEEVEEERCEVELDVTVRLKNGQANDKYFETYTTAKFADWELVITDEDGEPVNVTLRTQKDDNDQVGEDAMDTLLKALIPLGHDWHEVPSTGEPKCDSEVSQGYVCYRCGANKSVESHFDHPAKNLDTFTVYVGADGRCPMIAGETTITYYYCTRCGKIFGEGEKVGTKDVSPVTGKNYRHFPFNRALLAELKEAADGGKLEDVLAYAAAWKQIDEWYKTYDITHFTPDLLPYLFTLGQRNCREGFSVACFDCYSPLYMFAPTDHQFVDAEKEDSDYYKAAGFPDCTKAGSQGYGYCQVCGLWINLTTDEPIFEDEADNKLDNFEKAAEATYLAPNGHSFVYGDIIIGDCEHKSYMGWYCEKCFTPFELSSSEWTDIDDTKAEGFLSSKADKNGYKKDNGSDDKTAEDIINYFKTKYGEGYFTKTEFKSDPIGALYLKVFEALGYTGDTAATKDNFEAHLGANAFLTKDAAGKLERGESSHKPSGLTPCTQNVIKFTKDGKLYFLNKDGTIHDKKVEGDGLTDAEAKMLATEKDFTDLDGTFDKTKKYADYCTVCYKFLEVADHTWTLRKFQDDGHGKPGTTLASGVYSSEFIETKDNGKTWVKADGTKYEGQLNYNIHYLQWLWETSNHTSGCWAVVYSGNGGWSASCWFTGECGKCGAPTNITTHLDPAINTDYFLYDETCSQNRICPICGYIIHVRPTDAAHKLVEMPVYDAASDSFKQADGTAYKFTTFNDKPITGEKGIAEAKKMWKAFIDANVLGVKSSFGECKTGGEKGDTVYVCLGCVISWYRANVLKDGTTEPASWTKYPIDGVRPEKSMAAYVTAQVAAHMEAWLAQHPEITDSDPTQNLAYKTEEAAYEKIVNAQVAAANASGFNWARIDNTNNTHSWKDDYKETAVYYVWDGSTYVKLTPENVKDYDTCRYDIYVQYTFTCTKCGESYVGTLDKEGNVKLNTSTTPLHEQYQKLTDDTTYHYVVPAIEYFTSDTLKFGASTASTTASFKVTCVVCGQTLLGEYTYSDLAAGRVSGVKLLVTAWAGRESGGFRTTENVESDAWVHAADWKSGTLTVSRIRVQQDTVTGSTTKVAKVVFDEKVEYKLALSATTKKVTDKSGIECEIREVTRTFKALDADGKPATTDTTEVIGWGLRLRDAQTATQWQTSLASDETALKNEFANGGEHDLYVDLTVEAQSGGSKALDTMTDLTLNVAAGKTLTWNRSSGNIEGWYGDLVIAGSDPKNPSHLKIENQMNNMPGLAGTYGGSVTLENLIIEATTSSVLGAQGDEDGKGTLTIKNCIIVTTGNTAIKGNTNEDNVEIVIENSTIIGYEFALANLGGKLTAKNSTFYGSNGAVFVRGGEATFDGCTFISSGRTAGFNNWDAGTNMPQNTLAVVVLGNGSTSNAYGDVKATFTNGCKVYRGHSVSSYTANSFAHLKQEKTDGYTQIGNSGYYFQNEADSSNTMNLMSITTIKSGETLYKAEVVFSDEASAIAFGYKAAETGVAAVIPFYKDDNGHTQNVFTAASAENDVSISVKLGTTEIFTDKVTTD